MTAPTVFPALSYDDAPAAIKWLTSAFGLTEHFVAEGPDGTVAHAELAWGEGGMIMLGSTRDSEDDTLRTGRCWLYLIVDDPDAHYERAVAAGAEVVRPLKDEDYGSRGYTVRDPEGHLWSFGTYRPASGN
ncbi:VOC family protein [Actinomadura sp. 6N118]|uniref:VOC family protein n=1 Tax=Actinomadura sp. 6N118 TaxID=3375151 RepID=UPI003791232D